VSIKTNPITLCWLLLKIDAICGHICWSRFCRRSMATLSSAVWIKRCESRIFHYIYLWLEPRSQLTILFIKLRPVLHLLPAGCLVHQRHHNTIIWWLFYQYRLLLGHIATSVSGLLLHAELRGRTVCLVVTCKPCKNGWTDRDAIWDANSGETKEPYVGWEPRFHKGNILVGKWWPIVKYRHTLRWAVQKRLNWLRYHHLG